MGEKEYAGHGRLIKQEKREDKQVGQSWSRMVFCVSGCAYLVLVRRMELWSILSVASNVITDRRF